MPTIDLTHYILIRETNNGIVVFTKDAQWISYNPNENIHKWMFWKNIFDAEKALRKLNKYAIIRPYIL